MASDLTQEEQAAVRAAMRFLSVRFGKILLLAKALGFKENTVYKVIGQNATASPTMAFRVARLAGTGGGR
jgi:plasmid maintenance system antidote protein VapI